MTTLYPKYIEENVKYPKDIVTVLNAQLAELGLSSDFEFVGCLKKDSWSDYTKVIIKGSTSLPRKSIKIFSEKINEILKLHSELSFARRVLAEYVNGSDYAKRKVRSRVSGRVGSLISFADIWRGVSFYNKGLEKCNPEWELSFRSEVFPLMHSLREEATSLKARGDSYSSAVSTEKHKTERERLPFLMISDLEYIRLKDELDEAEKICAAILEKVVSKKKKMVYDDKINVTKELKKIVGALTDDEFVRVGELKDIFSLFSMVPPCRVEV